MSSGCFFGAAMPFFFAVGFMTALVGGGGGMASDGGGGGIEFDGGGGGIRSEGGGGGAIPFDRFIFAWCRRGRVRCSCDKLSDAIPRFRDRYAKAELS